MSTPFQPKAYSAFVSLLGKEHIANQPITRDQLFGGVAYYLTELPQNYIQPFAAIIVSSPALWGPSPRTSPSEKIHSSSWGVMQATQQAVFAKHAALLVDPNTSSILPPLGRQRVLMAFKDWIDLLVSGSQPRTGFGDCSIPRLAFLTGLVLGLRDLRDKDTHVPDKALFRARAELVVSVAECLDQYATPASMDVWDTRRALRVRETESHLDTIVVLCAMTLPLVPNEQLEVLDLSKLTCVTLGCLLHVFQNGRCFGLLEAELVTLDSGLLDFKPQSKIPQVVRAIHNSSVYIHLGSIVKLVGHLFVAMAQSKFWQPELYPILLTYVDAFGQMDLNLEKPWARSTLCTVNEDEKIVADARPTTTSIWHILKSVLFATVLVAQSVLDVVIYYRTATHRESKVLSRGVLIGFCRLSFVSFKFGALAAEGGGFKEMKRAFFGALDVLASNADEQDFTGDQSCVTLVTDLASELTDIGFEAGVTNPIYQGRITYFLVCTEHVMNQLTEEAIEKTVLPIVQGYLTDTQNRETYEAAHSVMLAIFASSEAGLSASRGNTPFSRAHVLVPAYISILLQNSDEGKLSTDQLCLAFQDLVRSAGSSDEELGWFCIEELTVAIRQLSAVSGAQPSEPSEISTTDTLLIPNLQIQTNSDERLLRLQLSLIALISTVPMSKLPLLLEIVQDQIAHGGASKDPLTKAAYNEIMERLGDREKDIALKWWMKVKGGDAH